MAKSPENGPIIEIQMKLDKSTKGTHVYVEGEVENPKVPSIYIRKSAFKGEPPATITLVIK